MFKSMKNSCKKNRRDSQGDPIKNQNGHEFLDTIACINIFHKLIR